MSKKPCSISFKPTGKNKPCTTVINGGLKVKKNIVAECDLKVKKCLNVKNIVYSNTETITESGQTVSGVKSLSWINTNGTGVLSDNTKDGFYKKVIYIGSYSQTSVIFDEGGTTGTFIVPDGVTSIIVEAYGAGGGGAVEENDGYSGGDTKWDTIISGGGKGAEGFGNIGVGGTVDGNVDSFENGQSGDENGNGGNGGGPLGGSGGTGSPLSGSNGQTYGGGGGGVNAYGSGGGAYFLKTYDVKASDLFDYEIGKGGTSESSNGTTGADGAIILTYNVLITEPYTLEYNGGETTVLTNVGENVCFIYNDELNKWIKLI